MESDLLWTTAPVETCDRQCGENARCTRSEAVEECVCEELHKGDPEISCRCKELIRLSFCCSVAVLILNFFLLYLYEFTKKARSIMLL